ncbi:MAG TPA: hypothetical protein VHM31_05680 [Polyangia bacterium]|nr:hypothetical protein [Polyangia bacterium]
MDKRTSLSMSAVVIVLMTWVSARAAETRAADAPKPAPEHAVRKKAATTQSVAPHPLAADDAYRCHPSEDISCTVIRETAGGTMIVTLRPAGQSAVSPAWIVVSGAPPSPGPHPPGTIWVVPSSTGQAEPSPQGQALNDVNGAPILD